MAREKFKIQNSKFKMKRGWITLLALLFLFTQMTSPVAATSSYVLPYPSAMPGSIGYKMHLVWEKVMQFWYFGNFGQFTYNLNESDKYLVEAKTLFEYNQYLLGYSALQKSNAYFSQVSPFLLKAKREGKDITEKRELLRIAAEKHIEVLEKLKQELPKEFIWKPEKSSSVDLHLNTQLDTSIADRMTAL